MMGLGDMDLLGDKGGEAAAAAAAAVACSICLDAVTGAGDRATARLQCGHQFHLDCIGSAFNAKGVMQCPNCRKVEKGNWLYANGSCSLPDLTMHEWANDEDLYDLNYSEMPFGVHWCPFGRLARVTSSFEEGESSPAISFQDLVGHQSIFTEQSTTPAAHPCPYMAYFPPLQPSSTSNSHVFSGSLVDGSAYPHHWCQVPPADVQSHVLPPIDHHYDIWEHHSPAYSVHGGRTSNADQVSVSSATTRASRLDSDGLPRAGQFMYPFIPRHRFRSAGSFAPSSIPYVGTSEAQARVHEHHQHHNSPGMHGTVFTGVRRPGGTRGAASTGATSLSPSDQSGYYYLFPPTRSPNRSFQDVENNTEGSRFYAWERDQFAPFTSLRVDRESGWWGPFPQPTASSDSNNRMGFWHWHAPERSSAHGRSEGSSYRPVDARMRPFI